MRSDPRVDDAARSILDGEAVDWSALEASSDQDTLGLIEQLKLLSEVGRAVEEHVWELPEDSEDSVDLDGVMMADAEVLRAITKLANKLREVSPVDLAAFKFLAREDLRPALMLTQGGEPSDPQWPVWRRIA